MPARCSAHLRVPVPHCAAATVSDSLRRRQADSSTQQQKPPPQIKCNRACRNLNAVVFKREILSGQYIFSPASGRLAKISTTNTSNVALVPKTGTSTSPVRIPPSDAPIWSAVSSLLPACPGSKPKSASCLGSDRKITAAAQAAQDKSNRKNKVRGFPNTACSAPAPLSSRPEGNPSQNQYMDKHYRYQQHFRRRNFAVFLPKNPR